MADGKAWTRDSGTTVDPLRDVAMISEPERYIAATLSPRDAQAGLIALAAFTAEIARIPAVVGEATLGLIRLQWWREAVEAGLKGGASGHPVADAFVETLLRERVDATWALEMIEARELDLSGALVSDDAGLFAYLDKTEGHAFRLALALLGAKNVDAAMPAGRAYGLARALSRLAAHHHNGGLPLPADRLERAGIQATALGISPIAEETHRAVDLVVGDLRREVMCELAVARTAFRGLPRRQQAALLPLAMVEPYLRSQTQSRMLDYVGGPGPLARVVRMGLARFSGRV